MKISQNFVASEYMNFNNTSVFRKETIYVGVKVHGKNEKEGHRIEIRLE